MEICGKNNQSWKPRGLFTVASTYKRSITDLQKLRWFNIGLTRFWDWNCSHRAPFLVSYLLQRTELYLSSNIHDLVRFNYTMTMTHCGIRLVFYRSHKFSFSYAPLLLEHQCGSSLLIGPSGWFTSPKYLSNIARKRTCEWEIHVNEGDAVRIEFVHLRTDEVDDGGFAGRNYIRVSAFSGFSVIFLSSKSIV